MWINRDIWTIILFFSDKDTAFSLKNVSKEHAIIVNNDSFWKPYIPKTLRFKSCKTELQKYFCMQRIRKNKCPLCVSSKPLKYYGLIICNCLGSYVSYHIRCLSKSNLYVTQGSRGTTACICPHCKRCSQVMIFNHKASV